MNKEHLTNYLVAWLQLNYYCGESDTAQMLMMFAEEHGINLYQYVEWTIDENENPIFEGYY